MEPRSPGRGAQIALLAASRSLRKPAPLHPMNGPETAFELGRYCFEASLAISRAVRYSTDNVLRTTTYGTDDATKCTTLRTTLQAARWTPWEVRRGTPVQMTPGRNRHVVRHSSPHLSVPATDFKPPPMSTRTTAHQPHYATFRQVQSTAMNAAMFNACVRKCGTTLLLVVRLAAQSRSCSTPAMLHLRIEHRGSHEPSGETSSPIYGPPKRYALTAATSSTPANPIQIAVQFPRNTVGHITASHVDRHTPSLADYMSAAWTALTVIIPPQRHIVGGTPPMTVLTYSIASRSTTVHPLVRTKRSHTVSTPSRMHSFALGRETYQPDTLTTATRSLRRSASRLLQNVLRVTDHEIRHQHRCSGFSSITDEIVERTVRHGVSKVIDTRRAPVQSQLLGTL